MKFETTDQAKSLYTDITDKTLGIGWNPESDEITYTIQVTDLEGNPTKRKVISAAAKTFDPLGLLSPVTITSKIIIQQIWEAGIQWDESLPMNIHSRVVDYFEKIKFLSNLHIPRFIGTTQRSNFEIHGFADASESAYGACVYFRSSTPDSGINVHLICSKTRVAPLKKITLPRLELCAAVLLARLVQRVLKALEVPPYKTFYYTDSIIVVSWIKSTSRKFKTFVSNRVGEIQELTKPDDWYHVSTKENPADLCSRGVNAEELFDNDLWWHGPAFLKMSTLHTSLKSSPTLIGDNELPEIKVLTTTIENDSPEIIQCARFSSWNRLIRSLAYALRFINKTRFKSKESNSGALTVSEIDHAITILVKQIQRKHFHQDIRRLENKQPLKRKSTLLSLAPFLDEDEILRVGGRLKNARLPYTVKHPILLPHGDHVTELLIRCEHLRGLHSGIQTTLALVRQRFWIVRARSVVRRTIRKCVTCFRAKPIFHIPQMGNLPAERVTPMRPFLQCGVDYLGPIMIKDGLTRSRKTIKAYIALFICFSTKAIHLEVVTSLTTETFLAALRRFISRRGKPIEMHSDNATNFVGANHEMEELHDLFLQENQEFISDKLAMEGIKWKFIPPRSPTFGGIWESAVKLFKHHFKRVIGEAHLTYEELLTLTTQIECILNSRPITTLSEDPNDLSYLTPFHFLIGDYPSVIPEPSLLNLKLNRLSRYQLVQRSQQHFWQRWQRDYLLTLQRRTKWKQNPEMTITTGDLVVMYEDGQPPLQWKLGRIEAVHPGDDNINRVVTVRTSSGTFRRAVNRLAKLPLDQ